VGSVDIDFISFTPQRMKTMKNMLPHGKFAIGVITGISTLALAIPILAQVSNAQSVGSSTSAAASTGTGTYARVPPGSTQASVQAMITKDNAFLSNVDAYVSVEKSAVQAHEAALTAAALITDTTQREAAVKAANQAEQTAIKNAVQANTNLKSGMMPFGGRGFGGGFGGHGGMGMRGPGMNLTALAQKLGMTTTDLQTELKSGKTIQQIATEKGVTLPTPPRMGQWHGKGASS